MLTVTLVATFAAAAMWQQWRSIEVETAERARVQSAWILVGALDWSRLILAEDANAGPVDHLAEPWAIPLEEARLSTFLAAERNVAQVPDASTDTSDAFLSGQIIDLQSRLNLANLAHPGAVQEEVLEQFNRLFARLGLPPSELTALAQGLAMAQDTDDSSANVPLMPQTLDQLAWLGVSPATLAALAPHATLLPERGTRLNINTASAEALMASIEGLDTAGANKLLAVRQLQHFRTLADARTLLGTGVLLLDSVHDVKSSYFEVRGRLRLGDVTVHERSLVRRVGRSVSTLWRERGATVLASP
ncbi:MAG: type II secretion system minor pseudopilin GspK, partial [Simplicispira sp.]|nr:type II secretion system minor pseudopilin GspK [Simplicispira sp.]